MLTVDNYERVEERKESQVDSAKLVDKEEEAYGFER